MDEGGEKLQVRILHKRTRTHKRAKQSAFFPLYEEMEKELFNANKEAKDIEKKIAGDTSANDTEYEAEALAITKVSQKEGEIEMKYFEKFEKF